MGYCLTYVSSTGAGMAFKVPSPFPGVDENRHNCYDQVRLIRYNECHQYFPEWSVESMS